MGTIQRVHALAVNPFCCQHALCVYSSTYSYLALQGAMSMPYADPLSTYVLSPFTHQFMVTLYTSLTPFPLCQSPLSVSICPPTGHRRRCTKEPTPKHHSYSTRPIRKIRRCAPPLAHFSCTSQTLPNAYICLLESHRLARSHPRHSTPY